jgi:hypothetical protein
VLALLVPTASGRSREKKRPSVTQVARTQPSLNAASSYTESNVLPSCASADVASVIRLRCRCRSASQSPEEHQLYEAALSGQCSNAARIASTADGGWRRALRCLPYWLERFVTEERARSCTFCVFARIPWETLFCVCVRVRTIWDRLVGYAVPVIVWWVRKWWRRWRYEHAPGWPRGYGAGGCSGLLQVRAL